MKMSKAEKKAMRRSNWRAMLKGASSILYIFHPPKLESYDEITRRFWEDVRRFEEKERKERVR